MPAAPLASSSAAHNVFTMRALWRLAVWGGAASASLALAVLASRSEVGAERVHTALASVSGRPSAVAQIPRRSFDAEGETKRLSEAVRVLTSDRDRLTTRVAALEQNLDDVTGSVTKQIEAAREAVAKAATPPWPADEIPALSPPATIAATLAVVPPSPIGLPSIPPGAAPTGAPSQPAGDRHDFAVDIGGGPTIESLRVRWNAINRSHAQLFEGLDPRVTVNDTHKASRVELRLVVGPLPNADAATRLCAALAASRIVCQPTMFEGQRMALR